MQPFEEREGKWKNLCEEYLPLCPDDSIWRYSRSYTHKEPKQGWKLHISATIESCIYVLSAVAPLLKKMDVLYKAPVSLVELKKINCGLFYGYGQIGKFITVYPSGVEEAVLLIKKLFDLTQKWTGPIIPFDRHYKGLIYYRYGAFTNDLKINTPDGNDIPAIKDNFGRLVPDARNSDSIPDWLDDPFKSGPQDSVRIKNTPISTTIKVFEALSQRGKGGVYKALDFGGSSVRFCVLKEGRKYGEVDWDNRDGYWRVKHELEVLKELSRVGIPIAPKIYQSFEENHNFYLVLEYIEGIRLQELISKKISIMDAMNYSLQITEFMAMLHDSGWCWRDCKPLNFIITPENIVRALDFEGACKIDEVNEFPWGTSGYIPPEWSKINNKNLLIKQDFYALGATMHHIFSSRIPTSSSFTPIGKLRKNIPKEVRYVIQDLLSVNPEKRPNALKVKQVLQNALHNKQLQN